MNQKYRSVWRDAKFEFLYNEESGIIRRILFVNGFKEEGNKNYNLIANPYIKYFQVNLNNVSRYLML
jgi:hypothetical protein